MNTTPSEENGKDEPGVTDNFLIVAEVAGGQTPAVGAVPRPPRLLTYGRRRSDRWVAYALALFLVVCSFFVVGQAFRMETLIRYVESQSQTCPK